MFAGTLLCLNSPVDPALLQLVQQEVKFLQDSINNLSIEFDQDRVKVQQELQNAAAVNLEAMKRMVERLNLFQGNDNYCLLTLPNPFWLLDLVLIAAKYFLTYMDSSCWIIHVQILYALSASVCRCRSEVWTKQRPMRSLLAPSC